MLEVGFAPPGPGSWILENVHAMRPISVYGSSYFPQAVMEGQRRGFGHYGAPLKYLEHRVIEQFLYFQPRLAGVPSFIGGNPPKWLFEFLHKLHPALRHRTRKSRRAFENKVWRDDLKWWDTEIKPALIAKAAELRDVDLGNLDTEGLVDHICACRSFAVETIHMHHRMTGCALFPLMDFLSHTADWTGLPPERFVSLFEGYSKISLGSVDELAALGKAFEQDPMAQAIALADQNPADILATLRAWPAPVGNALSAYEKAIGYRMLSGYDVSELMAIESPEIMLRLVRAALSSGLDQLDRVRGDTNLARLRDKVPAPYREQFDQMLAEARLTYRVRDERVGYGDAHSVGLLRRALLEAGRRLTREGKLHDPAHIVDAYHDQVVNLLWGRTKPGPDELAARAEYRANYTTADAPPFLGQTPQPPPPLEWYPSQAQRITRAFNLMITLAFGRGLPNREVAPEVVRGLGVVPGTYEGTARVIKGVFDMERIEPGDILISQSTTPSFNVILPLVGAVVTDRGGVMSHAAIVAREYGLPAVVDCGSACQSIPDGARVQVDGEAGEVKVLA